MLKKKIKTEVIMRSFKISVVKVLTLLVAMLMLGTSTFAQVSVSLPNVSGIANSTGSGAITVGDVTGQNVNAFEFAIPFNAAQVEITGVTAGALLAGQENYLNSNIANGKITVAWAGATALTGSGSLVNIQFTFKATGGPYPLQFDPAKPFIFNGGSPVATVANGSMLVPQATLTPFPVTGPVRVGDEFLIPINVSALTVVDNLTAYNFVASFDKTKISILDVTIVNTLTAAASGQVDKNINNIAGTVNVAGATANPIITTGGVIVYLKAKALATGNFTVGISNVILNGGTPVGGGNPGSYTIVAANAAPTLTLSNNGPISAVDGTEVAITLTAADADGSIVNYAVSGNLGGALDPVTHIFSWTPTLAQRGTSSTIVFSVTDNYGTTTTKSVVVNVAANAAPTLAVLPTGDQSININQKLTLTLTPADANATDLVGLAPVVTSPATLPGDAKLVGNVFTWTPVRAEVGSYTFKFKVTDRTGLASNEVVVNVTVNNVNTAPSFVVTNAAQMADVTLYEGQPLSYIYKAVDAEGDAISYFKADPSPATASINPTSGLLTYTPAIGDAGKSISIVVFASDGALTTASRIAKVTVLPAPVPTLTLSAQAPYSVEEKSAFALTLTGSSLNPGVSGYTYSVTGLPAAATVSAAGLLSWTPNYGEAGSYNVTFKVTDNFGKATTATAVITVNKKKEIPTLVLAPAAPYQVTEGQKLSFTLVGSDLNPTDVATLVYSITSKPEGATLSAAGVFEWTPAVGKAGTYNVNLIVTDADGLATTVPAVIVVNAANAPVLTLTPAGPFTVAENSKLEISLTATDSNPNQTLKFTATGLPEGATLDETSGKFAWTPAFGKAGTYNVIFKVTDSPLGLSSSTPVAITVTYLNVAPVLAVAPAAPYTVDQQKEIALTLSATDANPGEVLTYTATSVPAGAVFDAAAKSFKWTPSYAQVGDFTVTFTVTDAGGLKSSFDAKITVKKVNVAPTIAIDPVGPAFSVTDGQLVKITVTGADVNPDDVASLAITAAGLPTGAAFDKGVFTWTPTVAQRSATAYSVVFTVTDQGGLKSTVTAAITVTQNAAPTLTLSPAGAISVNENVKLTIALVGADGNPSDVGSLKYTITAPATLPTGATLTGSTFTWTPTYDQGRTAVYPFTFTVTDQFGATGTATVNITVVDVQRAPVFTAELPYTVVPVVVVDPKWAVPGPKPFTFTYLANSPEGKAIIFSLVAGPAGSQITSDGVFTWAPTVAQKGNVYTITVQVSDGKLTALSTQLIAASTTITDVEKYSGVPTDYTLFQNYPNPFNPSTSIKVAIPKEGNVKLTVYNILGEEVAVLANGYMTAGYHNFNFDASKLTSGMYLYRVEANQFVSVKKMLLIK